MSIHVSNAAPHSVSHVDLKCNATSRGDASCFDNIRDELEWTAIVYCISKSCASTSELLFEPLQWHLLTSGSPIAISIFVGYRIKVIAEIQCCAHEYTMRKEANTQTFLRSVGRSTQRLARQTTVILENRGGRKLLRRL
jgi:hypothetical protein